MCSTLFKTIKLFSLLFIFAIVLPENLNKSRQTSITRAIEKVGPAVASVSVEQQLNSINKAVDRAMLRSNPDFEKFNMKYENGFFVPISYKKLLEKEG